MSLSIRGKLLMMGVGALVIAIVIGTAGYLGVYRVDSAMDEIVDYSKAINHHMNADMMHDALRADVLSAIVAAQSQDLASRSRIEANLREHADQFTASLAANDAVDLNSSIKVELTRARPALNAYIQQSNRIVNIAFTQGAKAALAEMPKFNSDFDKLAEVMETLSGQFDKSTDATQAAGDSAVVLSKDIIIIVSVLAALVLIFTSIAITRSITQPLDAAVRFAERIASGKLDNTINITSNDETGRLLQSLVTMNESLSSIVNSVIEGATAIKRAAAEVAEGNTNLSQRTEEQASSLEETASSMEEMTSTVKQNADNAKEAKQLADANRQRASSGAEVVNKTVSAMSEINASSTRIADIIGTIDGIAFQTNLLALNAAVEAARAGEQGRGFAVVASEVRSLAQRSAEAAKEIKGLIEDSVEKVKNGTNLVDESGKTLEEIIGGTQRVADIIAEIAAASIEQASGIDQVNNAVTQMDNMTQDNAALVEEAAAASRSMDEQADNMNRLMTFFDMGASRQHIGTSSVPGQQTASQAMKTARPSSNRMHLDKLKRTGGQTKGDQDWEKF